MAYSHTTWTQLQTLLSARLGDTNQTFWTSTEIPLYLTEALRTFGLTSGFWRERGTFNSTASTAFYDLHSLLSNSSGLILAPTVTDRNIIQLIQFALLESASSQTSWGGTEMYTYADIVAAVQNRLNQFMSDTGIVVTRSVISSSSPQIGREVLSQTVVDVRRAAWLGASPQNYYNILWRDDERLMTAASGSWSITPGIPAEYSVMASPPLQIQLSPPPITSGQIELLIVSTKTLDPANTATVLGIPDNLTPAIKWGALADLLGKDGISSDPVRADFCEKRYQQYVQMARLMPVVIHTELDGKPLLPSTLAEMDGYKSTWQNVASGALHPVEDVLLASANLIGLSAVPSTIHSVSMDVVRAAPIPVNGTDYVQVGLEQIDMILDYAESLALFKCGGEEWHYTDRQADNFLLQSITYNQRLSASARAAASSAFQSQREKKGIPRRVDAWLKKTFGVGAVTVGEV